MLIEIYPRCHARYSSLRVLGPHLDGFIHWLRSQGYPRYLIRLRVRATRKLDALLGQQGVHGPGDLTAEQLLAYAPRDSQQDIELAAVVRALARYFGETHLFAPSRQTPAEQLLASYRKHLERVRGLAPATICHHAATVGEWLAHLGYDQEPARLHALERRALEEFLERIGGRVGRESLQHAVAHLRCFLRFLASGGLAPAGLDTQLDTPRVYRGERLPRALPWDLVRAFLQSIDRSTPMGRRDYAMFLLIASYGLRSCEVVALTLDDIEWRARRLCVTRPKVRSTLVLPLTDEVGAAILGYMRAGRPELPHREVFLRERAPAGTLKPTAVTEAFQGRVRRSGLPIRAQGPHCLRHSLAVHLLRQGESLKAIGDLLGHRSTESTCVYLRLHVEDLREVALDLPADALSEVQP